MVKLNSKIYKPACRKAYGWPELRLSGWDCKSDSTSREKCLLCQPRLLSLTYSWMHFCKRFSTLARPWRVQCIAVLHYSTFRPGIFQHSFGVEIQMLSHHDTWRIYISEEGHPLPCTTPSDLKFVCGKIIFSLGAIATIWARCTLMVIELMVAAVSLNHVESDSIYDAWSPRRTIWSSAGERGLGNWGWLMCWRGPVSITVNNALGKQRARLLWLATGSYVL